MKRNKISDRLGNLTEYGEKVHHKRMIKRLEKMGLIKNNKMKIRLDSTEKAIKTGDFVITYEIHKVVGRFDKNEFSCVEVFPVVNKYRDKEGIGVHSYIKHIGPGQQGITKIIKK